MQIQADPRLYVNAEEKNWLLVYVDDMAAAAHEISSLEWFYNTLSGRSNTKNLGEINKILGVRVTRVTRDRKNRKIYLDQEQYISGVLGRFGITNEKDKPKAVSVADYEHL